MIDTYGALERLIDEARKREAVALDTEFVWEQTYYPRLGVVQLGFSEEEVFLVDAAELEDLSPLAPLMKDEAVVKILHDAQQDLTILTRATGAHPRAIFDTQLAAGFAGLRSTISLAGLMQELFDLHLPKTESRTDWLRRPLSKAQRAYALDDVRHLPAARRALLERVASTEKEAWLREELATYDDPDRYDERDLEKQYERVKGAGRLRPKERAVLRELAAWREEEARQRDVPRGHVLDDSVLASLARQQPQASSEVRTQRGLTERKIRQYGKDVTSAVNRALALPREAWPKAPPRARDDESFEARLNLALALLKGRSLAHGVDPNLVATRANVQELVRANGSDEKAGATTLMQGWRRTFLGDPLRAVLTGDQALRVDLDSGLPRLVP